MNIRDRIHGLVEVTDPLIVELLQSKPMQRLKKISQDGATHFVQPQFDGDRFEHSFGTWYLAKHFDRPIEEQVACLLHDVPHTAFSHVVDFVMGDDKQEFHDRYLEQIVMASDVPAICERHGLDIAKVLRKEDFYLLDNHTPELSFDRWDYVMRDAYMLGFLPLGSIRSIIDGAAIKDGQFYFTDQAVAGQLCISSLMLGQLAYASPTVHGAWFLLANALKAALKTGVITEEDLFTTDEEVWSKLESSDHPVIKVNLGRLQHGLEFVRADASEAEFSGPNKARYIDPKVASNNGALTPVSQLVPGLADYIQAYKDQSHYLDVRQKV